jgi:hypothetical protein
VNEKNHENSNERNESPDIDLNQGPYEYEGMPEGLTTGSFFNFRRMRGDTYVTGIPIEQH